MVSPSPPDEYAPQGPGEVSLFLYDNGTFVVESFRDQPVSVDLLLDQGTGELRDLMSGEKIPGRQRIAPEFMGRKFGRDVSVFSLDIPPHSFRAFSREDLTSYLLHSGK